MIFPFLAVSLTMSPMSWTFWTATDTSSCSKCQSECLSKRRRACRFWVQNIYLSVQQVPVDILDQLSHGFLQAPEQLLLSVEYFVPHLWKRSIVPRSHLSLNKTGDVWGFFFLPTCGSTPVRILRYPANRSPFLRMEWMLNLFSLPLSVLSSSTLLYFITGSRI